MWIFDVRSSRASPPPRRGGGGEDGGEDPPISVAVVVLYGGWETYKNDCGIQTPSRERQAGARQAQPLLPLHLFPIFLLTSYPLPLPQYVEGKGPLG